MKQIISLLVMAILFVNITFSQTKTASNPVKKVVTSKITKDPKTGKVVKTITTVTTTDIVLVPGTTTNSTSTPKAIVPKKTTATTSQKVVAKTSVAKTQKPVAKPKTTVKPKPVVAKAKIAPKEEESGSIFANTNDISTKSAEKPVEVVVVEEKPEVNKPFESIVTKKATTSTAAQEPVKKVFKETKYRNGKNYFGLRAGLNFAKVDNAKSLTPISSATINHKLGLNAGLLMNFALGKVLSVQPEVNYSQQGYELTNGFDNEQLNNTNLNVPVLLKLTTTGDRTRFFINAGPYFGLKLKSEKVQEINGLTIRNLTDFKTEAGKEIQVNRYDYGLQAGAGLQFNLGGPLLELEGRYNYGLADPAIYTITKPSYVGTTGQNRLLTGTIALLFPIGK